MNYMKVVGSSQKFEIRNLKKARKSFLTLVCFLIFYNINAQIASKSIPELRQEMSTSFSNIPPFQYSKTPIFQHSNILFNIYHLPLNLSPYKPISLYTNSNIPNLHRYEHLPIFCKIEVKMEQAAKFPIKVRLGDVEYVDRLEGKRN